MKTRTPLFTVTFSIIVCLVFVTVDARAETDAEYEVSLRQRQRDFNSYIKDRNTVKADVAKAAAQLNAARVADEARRAEYQRAYQKSMKRYSMEEVEARDREDDERLLRERAHADATRALYVEARERRRSIESSIGPLDPYTEFDINMAVPPETKVSHPAGAGDSSAGADAL